MMSYLIQEILLCLIISAILGFTIGWLLRGISAKNRERYLGEQFENRMQTMKNRFSSANQKQVTNRVAVVRTDEPVVDSEDNRMNEAHIDDYFIEVIEDIGQSRGRILREMGVSMVHEFLLKYRLADSSRTELADKLDIDQETVRRWVSIADLMRIQGVGSQYSELLEASGVHSVPALAQQDVTELVDKMQLVNQVEHSTILTLPDDKQVTEWIEIAKSLPAMISE